MRFRSIHLGLTLIFVFSPAVFGQPPHQFRSASALCRDTLSARTPQQELLIAELKVRLEAKALEWAGWLVNWRPDMEDLQAHFDIIHLPYESLLECPVCHGVSRHIFYYLARELDDIELSSFQIVRTIGTFQVRNVNVSHDSIVVWDFFEPGSPLIIDASFRQFFLVDFSREELNSKIPLVFVGSAAEARSLFKILEEKKGLPVGTLSRKYLDFQGISVLVDQ